MVNKTSEELKTELMLTLEDRTALTLPQLAAT